MAQLKNGIAIKVLKGDYQLVINSPGGAGTVVLSYSVAGFPFQNITGASFTGSNGDIISLPFCKIKATITGDSQVELIDFE